MQIGGLFDANTQLGKNMSGTSVVSNELFNSIYNRDFAKAKAIIINETGPEGSHPWIYSPMTYLIHSLVRDDSDDIDQSLAFIYWLKQQGAQISIDSVNTAINIADSRHDPMCFENVYTSRPVEYKSAKAAEKTALNVLSFILDLGGPLEYSTQPEIDYDITPPNNDFGYSGYIRRGEGFSPLHTAAAIGNVKLSEELIIRGAWIDVKCAYGFTPVMIAAGSNMVDELKYLLNMGAALDNVSIFGHTLATDLRDFSGPVSDIIKLHIKFKSGPINIVMRSNFVKKTK